MLYICKSHFGASKVPFIVTAKEFLLEWIYSLKSVDLVHLQREKHEMCSVY